MPLPTYSTPGGQAVKATIFIQDPNLALDGGPSGFRAAMASDFLPSFSSVSSSTISGSLTVITTGLVFPANPQRRTLYGQVVGSGGGPLWIAYSTVGASNLNFNVALKPSSVNYGGDGGQFSDNAYKGPVNVSGSSGCLYTLWQGS